MANAPPESAPPRRRERRPRQPIPPALKLIGATVAIALTFLVAAIVGGSSSEETTPNAVPGGETAAELGYPMLATNNTTRIGGSDPAANAAAVALAVYPSTAEAQRPDAVTLLDGESWQDAVAASVLMAAPVRAPLLISGVSDVPDATAQALGALDPHGSARTGGATAFAVGDAEAPETMRAKRAAGNDPASRAAAIAALRERLVGRPPAHLLVASFAEPGFAVPAAAWAARSGDPVLFTGKDVLPAPTVSVLKRHSEVPVYVLGPPQAVSPEVMRRIARVGGQVRRVADGDPVTNAIALARYADGDFGWNINDPGHGFVVARSDAPLEAAVASPLSASGTWGPLLLTDSADTLPLALRDYLLDIKPGYTMDPTRAFYNHVWLIGDEEAIAVDLQAEIDGLAEVARIRG
jgi:hypothetical protein